MSKGLEELKELKQSCETHMGRMVYILQEDRFETIEKELKELEERREMMKRFNEACVPMILDNETEKKLKAFEIIKDKKVDVCSFIDYFVESNKSYETYVLYFEKPIEIDYGVISEELLAQEEFDLLREVL